MQQLNFGDFTIEITQSDLGIPAVTVSSEFPVFGLYQFWLVSIEEAKSFEIIPKILGIISQDFAKGNGERIAGLLVELQVLALLFVEGAISEVEMEDINYLGIWKTQVNLEGKTYDLYVDPGKIILDDSSFATIDAEFNIIQ